MKTTLSGFVLGSLGRASAFDEKTPLPELIVRGEDPLNAETPVALFDSWITPHERFFVRSHLGAPGLAANTLQISGLVKTPLRLEELEVRRLETVTIPAVLQCSGNGRALFNPGVPGVGWERGAVGNAEWLGIRLKDLLELAGIGPKAKHIQFQGSDLPPHAKTPAYHRSIPIERAMDPSTLLAFGMNGPTIPKLHGGPFRLIVPGWTANHWMKWVREITASDEESPGFYQRTAYKMAKPGTPPGAVVKPEDMVSLTSMNVKSLIVAPTSGSTLPVKKSTISGVAWTGMGRVTKLEVSIDNGPWSDAEFVGKDIEGSWRLWRYSWNATSGTHTVKARATDSNGAVQPETTPWNKSGYLWNGIETVSFEVRRS